LYQLAPLYTIYKVVFQRIWDRILFYWKTHFSLSYKEREFL